MENLFLEPFKDFAHKVAGFLPNLLSGIIIIILGICIAYFVRKALTRVSLFLKVDRLSEKTGVEQVLKRGGIRSTLSGVIGQVAFWIILISFMIMGIDALKMPAAENMLEAFWRYLPNVIASAIVIVVGYLLGNFLGRAALIASVNAGLALSGLIGKFVKFTVFIMSATMAMEMLGIGQDTVLIAFAIVFGGVVLALAIAFGFGGRDAAKDYIDRMLKEKGSEDDISHI